MKGLQRWLNNNFVDGFVAGFRKEFVCFICFKMSRASICKSSLLYGLEVKRGDLLLQKIYNGLSSFRSIQSRWNSNCLDTWYHSSCNFQNIFLLRDSPLTRANLGTSQRDQFGK